MEKIEKNNTNKRDSNSLVGVEQEREPIVPSNYKKKIKQKNKTKK